MIHALDQLFPCISGCILTSAHVYFSLLIVSLAWNRCDRSSSAVTTSFQLTPVWPGSAVLQDYVDTGNRLKSSPGSGISMIEGGISNFVDSVKQCTLERPAVFSYLHGSSGLGKTQLAFALRRKVLYIPLGE